MLPRQSPFPRKSPARRTAAIPHRWLMVDARLGTAMPRIIAAMPARSGIIIRPYALNEAGRTALIRTIRRIGRAKRHILLLSGTGPLMGYNGWHAGGLGARTPRRRAAPIISVQVHNRREAARAQRWQAHIALISPVFATQSHPSAQTLGIRGFAPLAATMAKFGGSGSGRACAIALGGITAHRFPRLRYHRACGWAAIDGWQRQASG